MAFCEGFHRRRAERKAKRDERRAWRRDPVRSRRRLRHVKIAQSIILAIYVLYFMKGVGHLSDRVWFTWAPPLLTAATVIITAISFLCCDMGYESKSSLGWSIAADALCLSLQAIAVIGVIAAESSRQCFLGHSQEPEPPCGVVRASFVFSNILLSTYIHTIVRAALLIYTLRCQDSQQLPVTTRDESPPAYPADRVGPYVYPSEHTFRLDGAASKARRGGSWGASDPSSTTLSGLLETSYSADPSNASDGGKEDQPLLRW